MSDSNSQVVQARSEIKGQARRWVIKIGSALLTDTKQGLNLAAIESWVRQIAELKAQGIEVVLVSSGAVAEGMSRLGWQERPKAVHDLQAAAAVGQMGLIQAYESFFQQFDLRTAQILLGHDDISARDRYLNARATLGRLLQLNVVPIVNENDTVVTDEIRFGDNDTLGALVANLVDADLLVILTDQLGLYDSDPRSNSQAKFIDYANAGEPELEQMAGGAGSSVGTGGMFTKVKAAKLAARSGVDTVIAGGKLDNVLLDIYHGKNIGTLLAANVEPLTAKKQWLAGQTPNSYIVIDAGAENVLVNQGRSLLPIGVTAVGGVFERGDLVSIRNASQQEVARGIVNYAHKEAQKIIGKATDEIPIILNYQGEKSLVHRNNLVIL